MIKTGRIIYSILQDDSIVSGLVGNNIFPLIIPEGTQLPCIVYSRDFNNNYSKDYLTTSDSIITITVISEKYQEGIDISEAVFNALSSATIREVKSMKLTAGSEQYVEGQFIQNLTFMVQVV